MALTVGDENYRKLKRRESEIVYQLAAERCSADLALRLFSAEVIKDRIYQEGDNFGPHVVETDRIKVLLDAVIGTVKQNPSRFTTFIRVLRDMGLKDVSDFVNSKQVFINTLYFGRGWVQTTSNSTCKH